MKLLALSFILATTLPCLAAPRPSSAKPYTPTAGSKERKIILDSLRLPVQKQVGQKIVFYNVQIKAQSGWAYVQCIARDQKGRPLSYWDNMLPTIVAGLRQNGPRWKVTYWGAASDIGPLIEARQRNPRAPRVIFPAIPGAS